MLIVFFIVSNFFLLYGKQVNQFLSNNNDEYCISNLINLEKKYNLGKHSDIYKGRVLIPSKFRDELQQGCVITKGQDNCLQILTKSNWEEEAMKMASLPSTDRTSRQLRRALFSGAIDVKIDSAGRVQIPENLRVYSGIDINEEVTVTGSGPFVEVWSTRSWKKIQNVAYQAFANINEVKG